MNLRPWQTIRGRLLSLAIGLEMIMLAIMIANSIRLLHNAMSEQVHIQAEQLNPVLAAALTAPLAQRDIATMQAVLDESRTHEGLDYIVIIDKNGHRLASSGWAADQLLPEPSKGWALLGDKNGPRFNVVSPVVFQGLTLGSLHFGINLLPIKRAMRALFIQAMSIAVIEIILSSLILLLFGFWLTRHMKSLTQASLAVAAGNLCPPVVPEGTDDVGQLGTAFNIMSRAIVERVRELTLAKETAEAGEAKLSGITNSANDAILMMDPLGAISYWNPAATRILGYSAQEALGQPLHNLLAPEKYHEAYAKACPEFWRTGRGNVVGKSIEMLARTKNGSDIPIELSMAGVLLNGQWYAVGILRDISEIKQAQEQLVLKQEQLESLNRSLQKRVDETVSELRQKDQVLISQSRQAAMGEMIGNIAHQWRQPLNVLAMVIANLQCAQQDQELTEAYMTESVATANRLIQKMSTTINDFRDFFNPDKKMVDFSAREQVALVVNMVEAAFEKNSITIVSESGNDCILQGFPNEYSQVVLNLLNNARDAIIETRATLGQIVIALQEKDGMGVVTVRDNGGGIAENVLDKIFDPYFSTKSTGTGIGLYMSKMIIERNMNGRIEATTFAGGSEFSIRTPLAERNI